MERGPTACPVLVAQSARMLIHHASHSAVSLNLFAKQCQLNGTAWRLKRLESQRSSWRKEDCEACNEGNKAGGRSRSAQPHKIAC
eukprot:2875630-Amphidinium_carterae.1